MQEDNTIFVLQKAIRRFRIKVTDSTIKEFLQSHPFYPTLKSVCDALKKWNIKYFPLMLEKEEIRKLETPFIAHLNALGGQLAFVENIINNKVSYVDYTKKTLKEDFDTFSKKISGAVILIEKDRNSGEKDYRLKKQNEALNHSLLPLGGIIAMLLFFLGNLFLGSRNLIFQKGITGWELLLTKFMGIVASVFLILKEWKISTRLTEKICNLSSKTDCDLVLSSPASRLFGWVNWADAGLIYFTGTLLFLSGIQTTDSLGMLLLISFLSLPYPIFSIYYQAIKLKKWCPFCLMAQLILITEFVILFPAFKVVVFNASEILRLLLSFLIISIFWLSFKTWHHLSAKLEQTQTSFQKLKRNPGIFHFLLTKNGYIELPKTNIGNALVLGNPEASVTITAFLGLHCHPCALVFKKLKLLLANSSHIKIQAVFSVITIKKQLN
jgi:uncharacterized membrane protein